MKKALQVLISSLALAACAHFQSIDPPAQSDWARTLSEARRDVEAGNYDVADRVLAEFARTHPGTPEARESGFWKGVYLIDPANQHGSLADGIAALDAYLAADSAGVVPGPGGGSPPDRGGQRRWLPSAPRGLSATRCKPAVKDTVVVASKSKDEQIASLKDQLAKSKDDLAKVNAELDRIKKRLANPSN